MFPRKQYMDELVRKMHDGRVKIITGIRRSGKSFLLFNLFVRYLHEHQVSDEQIIQLSLEDISNAKYRDPFALDAYVRGKLVDSSKQYYVLLDEIQFVAEIQNPYVPKPDAKLTFVDVLLGLMKISNVDVYVTGSNSKMLSSDILTQFRDRGDEIRLYPLSFAEFSEAYEGPERKCWPDYCTYGGMPYVAGLSTHEEKSRYLSNLFVHTYLRDVVERHHLKNDQVVLEDLLDVLASSIGSLTNPVRLSHTFLSAKGIRINSATIQRYLSYFEDAFLISRANRYDVKGRKYLQSPCKYYYTDVGLRNARLGFRQQEESHLMENVLYCDLVRRGYNVDVGVVIANVKTPEGTKVRKQLEVDFVVNRGDQRWYIQSALTMETPEKREQELASLLRIPDSFGKIVVVRDFINPWMDDHGILHIGIEQFLKEAHPLRF